MLMIARDYLLPTETQDAVETQFIDRLLEHWGRWQRSDGLKLKPSSAGQVLGINSLAARKWDLDITDDQFTKLDRAVARLHRRLRGIVFLEYVLMAATQADKWYKIGLSREGYRQRLHAAQWAIVTALGQELEKWRLDSGRSQMANSAQDGLSHLRTRL